MYRIMWNSFHDKGMFLALACFLRAVFGMLAAGILGLLSGSVSVVSIISCGIISGWFFGLCGGTIFLYRISQE